MGLCSSKEEISEKKLSHPTQKQTNNRQAQRLGTNTNDNTEANTNTKTSAGGNNKKPTSAGSKLGSSVDGAGAGAGATAALNNAAADTEASARNLAAKAAQERFESKNKQNTKGELGRKLELEKKKKNSDFVKDSYNEKINEKEKLQFD
ncbi:hypothetical protein B5S31_g5447 [[Candida] boidinii]|uniref:Unnamed protein product n=1 Tax=Candida boidinii TaxID=5477 RepID=A0ACB5TNV0_CANBO|nr:hypothetical protein B5S31_g5447 [[Candida] boidinii]GME84629.1 unnamed protein product [[Candida] boidinii]GME92186.1 unnamed protein product [[Candida] boidinii]